MVGRVSIGFREIKEIIRIETPKDSIKIIRINYKINEVIWGSKVMWIVYNINFL